MIWRDASASDIWHVCHHLRLEDAEEQFAVRSDDDPNLLAADLIAVKPLAIKFLALCTDDGMPAILCGAFVSVAEPSTGVFRMLATDRLQEIGRDGHRFGKRRFIPAVMVPNLRRVETRILASHMTARRWVRSLGFAEEGICRALGKHGEDYVQVAWINPKPEGIT